MKLVYFVRYTPEGPVKIGFTNSLKQRLTSFRCASDKDVQVLRTIEGDRLTERWLHHHFAASHVRREWFVFSPEMLTVEPPSRAEILKLIPVKVLRPRDNDRMDRMERWGLAAMSTVTGASRREKLGNAGALLGVGPRRLLSILNGEISRVWADEYDGAREWYLQWATRQAAVLLTQSQELQREADHLASEVREVRELQASLADEELLAKLRGKL